MRFYELGLILLPRNRREQYKSVWLSEFENSNLNGSKGITKLTRFVSMTLNIRWAQSKLFRMVTSVLLTGALVLVYAQFMILRNPLLLLLLFFLAFKTLDFRETILRRAILATILNLAIISITHVYSAVFQTFRTAKYDNAEPLYPMLKSVGQALVLLAILGLLACLFFWFLELLSHRDVVSGGRFLGIPIALLASGFWSYEAVYWLEIFEIAKVPDQLIVQLSKVQQITSNLVIPLLFIWLAILTENKFRHKRPEVSLGVPRS